MKRVCIFIYLLSLIACGPKEFELPENVKEVMELAGENRPELEKVIQHFKDNGEIIKEEAAYYLIGNMTEQGYTVFVLVDSLGNRIDFNVLEYEDYEMLLDGWDSIEESIGHIHFELDTLVKDYQSISADYLINNIDLAYDAWDQNAWAQHLSFEQFCEYILPYRSSNEPLEEWRSYFIKELSWVFDSVKKPSSPVEAVSLVNNYIRSWFRFDPRFYEHPTDQGLQEILSGKMGRCEDMTNVAIYAMRALGIPVMSDFTPYWANTGNNHAWNAVLNENDSIVIFMGGESNPGEYKLRHKFAKVFRKTFAKQENSLAEKAEEWEKLPPYLNKSSIKDVTSEYCKTKNIKIGLNNDIPDSTNFAYICVFNSGEWKAIDFTRFYGNKAHYTNMGMGIAYLPVFYYDKKIIPAGDAFILTDSGKIETMIPDFDKKISVKPLSTTRRLTKLSTDFIEETDLNVGKEYILYYWNDKWVHAGNKIYTGEPLVYQDVPSNSIYWLVEENSRKEERIFTINDEGIQVWW